VISEIVSKILEALRQQEPLLVLGLGTAAWLLWQGRKRPVCPLRGEVEMLRAELRAIETRLAPPEVAK
jgi:hypothetical protein